MTIVEVTCPRCGVAFEPDRRAILAGTWRVCPDCRDGAPTVPATASLATDGVWRLALRCPHCGERHLHGGGDGDSPEYGHRQSHCAAGGGRGYSLVPVAAGAATAVQDGGGGAGVT